MKTKRVADNPDIAIYRILLVPIVALLPAFLGYGVAVLIGDIRFRIATKSRRKIMANLQGVFGARFTQKQLLAITRKFFRLRSCEMVDEMRLSGTGRRLTDLVEVHGLESAQTAMAAGKGAAVCGAHYGSVHSSIAVLGSLGFPVTPIVRRSWEADPELAAVGRVIHQIQRGSYAHHLKPNIVVNAENLGSAFKAVDLLRHDELIYSMVDSVVPREDHGRAVSVRLLDGQAVLQPGVITIAKLAGAPILMMFMRRSSDWRHQVLEISSIPLEGDIRTVLQRCASALDVAIRRDPAHWRFWMDDRVARLGLLSERAAGTPVPVVSSRGGA